MVASVVLSRDATRRARIADRWSHDRRSGVYATGADGCANACFLGFLRRRPIGFVRRRWSRRWSSFGAKSRAWSARRNHCGCAENVAHSDRPRCWDAHWHRNRGEIRWHRGKYFGLKRNGRESSEREKVHADRERSARSSRLAGTCRRASGSGASLLSAGNALS